MPTRHIALAPFLQHLRDRIDALDAEQLRKLIAAHAAALDPAARVPFLADFDGWGWDDDLQDERAWGEESWVEEMEDLFARAGRAFLAGDLVLARDAYVGCSTRCCSMRARDVHRSGRCR